MRSPQGQPHPSKMECPPRQIGGEITSEPTPPQPDGMFASSNEGRTPIARRPPDQSGGELPQSGSLHPPGGGIRRVASCFSGGLFRGCLVVGGRVGARGGDGRGGGVSWCSCCRSSFVAARIVGSLDSGSWVRVPPWWVVLERSSWGSPFPSTDSELHKCESVKPLEVARYPARL